MRLDHLLSRELFPPTADPHGHRHDSGVKASEMHTTNVVCVLVWTFTSTERCKRKQSWVETLTHVDGIVHIQNVEHSQAIFHQGRHDERRVDALALRADEGRGIAAISVGEPRAGCDPTISEWGNPITFG